MTWLPDWFEIMRAKTDYEKEMVDSAVSTFDVSEHEPPVVVGYPNTDSPAFGWVKGLRKNFKDGVAVLEAKFSDLLIDLENYQKISTAFFRNGRLKHVGFMGGPAPTIGIDGYTYTNNSDFFCFEYELKGNQMTYDLTAADEHKIKAESYAKKFQEIPDDWVSKGLIAPKDAPVWKAFFAVLDPLAPATMAFAAKKENEFRAELLADEAAGRSIAGASNQPTKIDPDEDDAKRSMRRFQGSDEDFDLGYQIAHASQSFTDRENDDLKAQEVAGRASMRKTMGLSGDETRLARGIAGLDKPDTRGTYKTSALILEI